MLHRDRRLAAAIEKSFSAEINKLAPGSYITVTEVDVSSDNKFATVWLSILGGNEELILATIIDNKPKLMRSLTSSVSIRRLPKVEIKLDDRPKHAQSIADKLKDIKKAK